MKNINYMVFVGLPREKKSIENIFKMLMVDFNTSEAELKSSRLQFIVDKKTMIAYILNNYLGFKTVETGRMLGLNHASIIHHVKKCDVLRKNVYKQKIDELKIKYLPYKLLNNHLN